MQIINFYAESLKLSVLVNNILFIILNKQQPYCGFRETVDLSGCQMHVAPRWLATQVDSDRINHTHFE